MKSIYKNVFFISIIIGLFNSCTDVVNVDVPNGGARLVVEASINWEKGTSGTNQTIKLSESTTYFSKNLNVPVTGASVTVTKNDDNTQFTFIDQNNGTYTTTNFEPVIGQSYTLNIQYNRQSYAATETLISVTEISKIEQAVEEGFSEDEIQLKIYFNDPANVDNYYLGEFNSTVNPVRYLRPLSDEFTDGNENFMEYDNEILDTGTSVAINLYGISENYYNYINILVQQSESIGGGPFQTTPVQLKGNCKNINNPNEEVLGYFRLSEVVRTNYTIE